MPKLETGAYHCEDDASVLCIGRYYEGEKIIGIFNFSEHDKTAWINESDGMYTDMISGGQRRASGVNISAYSFLYLKREDSLLYCDKENGPANTSRAT